MELSDSTDTTDTTELPDHTSRFPTEALLALHVPACQYCWYHSLASAPRSLLCIARTWRDTGLPGFPDALRPTALGIPTASYLLKIGGSLRPDPATGHDVLGFIRVPVCVTHAADARMTFTDNLISVETLG